MLLGKSHLTALVIINIRAKTFSYVYIALNLAFRYSLPLSKAPFQS